MRKPFVEINQFLEKIQETELFRHVKTPRVVKFLDSISFLELFLLWIGILIMFGVFYHAFSGEGGYLYDTLDNIKVTTISNAIYFSFVTATTTGFGDITPHGFYRIISILEAALGFILLAIVTSKLISLKQNVILDEMYELSFTEKINRLRSSLLLFRQNISRLSSKLEEKTLRKNEVREAYVFISSFEDILREILILLDRPIDTEFIKNLDPVSTELIFSSVVHSFEKLNEFFRSLDESGFEWKRDITLEFIQKCIVLDDKLFARLEKTSVLDKTIAELTVRNSKAITDLRGLMEEKKEAKE